MPSPIVTRFAPSPTGHLHIGGARSALFCWAFAKKNGGRFMLRIEDTDAARSSLESARGIIEDLHWLGIVNDLGPYIKPDGSIGQHDWDAASGRPAVGEFFQARRVPIYNKYLEQLVKSGRAYPAFESNEEIEAQRKAAVAAKQTYRYPRPAEIEFGKFNAALEARWKRAQAGERHVLRFAAPAEEIVVKDQVLGDVRYAPGEMDDFVIRKADGFPTYHFAVVVDDETMGVTHVMRAQEHLNNTPRHVALQKALGFREPFYAHMPLIFNMDGSKMSKRDKAKVARKTAKDAIAKDKSITPATLAAATHLDEKAIAQFLAADNDSIDTAAALAAHFKVTLPEVEVWDFRQNGYLPEAITNFVALLGWNPGLKTADGKDLEKFDMKFLADHFGIDRIGRTNAKFDRAKLLAFNADAINALPNEELAARWRAWCQEFEPEFAKAVGDSSSRWLLLARAVKPRAKTFRDGLRAAAFLLRSDTADDFDHPAAEKNLLANARQGAGLLKAARDRFDSVADTEWTPELLHSLIEQIGQQAGTGLGPVSQAIRVAIAGAAVSPPLGETLAVLGKRSAIARIDRCLAAFPTP